MKPAVKCAPAFLALCAGFAAVNLSGAGWTSRGHAQQPAPPPLEVLFGGPFNLIDASGAVRTDADFRGRYLLIYFGYTNCPDICPLNLEHMTHAMSLLGNEARHIQPLFITVDPKRDHGKALADYTGAFHPGLIGLTGSEAQIAAVARAYRVHRRIVAGPGAYAAGGGYLVDHASITYLVGPDGKFLTLFPHNTGGERMAGVIRKYLAGAPEIKQKALQPIENKK